MATNDKPKVDIPWGTLLPLIATVAGIVVTMKPLTSNRPAIPAEQAVGIIAEQDVDARLWQDPLAVAQKQKAALAADILAGRIAASRAQRHDISRLTKLLQQHASGIKGRVLLLAVMLDAGPYSEQSESRLRARQAVLAGLSESGFVPIDAEHIGFVSAPWPPTAEDWPVGASAAEATTLFPFEDCKALDNRQFQGPEHVLVLWLPAGNFDPYPLERFGRLVGALTNGMRGKIDVKLIGPTNSAGLENMIREARSGSVDKAAKESLDGVSIISARATAPDAMLLFESLGSQSLFDVPSLTPPVSPLEQIGSPFIGSQLADDFVKTDEKSVQQVIEQSVLRGPRGGLQFLRTIATDDIVLHSLINELALRGINVVPNGRLRGDSIVLVSERDSAYGRSLAMTFAALASGRRLVDFIAQRGHAPRGVFECSFLRGIDGRLPGDPLKEAEVDREPKNPLSQKSSPAEAPEGLNQSDYLRRFARVLKEENALMQKRGLRIRAVGLLGSDIYDKLMILQALRPEFPDAVFFTTNFDARFERRDDWSTTHNLVIASPFGSTLPARWQGVIPPFRDNIQTSLYTATLVATGSVPKSTAIELSEAPKIFEVSRRGAYDLNKRDYWFRNWLFSPGVVPGLSFAMAALLCMIGWIRANCNPSSQPGSTVRQRLRNWLQGICSSTTVWLICGVPIIVLSVALFAQTGAAAQEPLTFFSGISIWPSEMLRLISLLLAIHFMIKASVDLRANEQRISEIFSFAPLPRHRWGALRLKKEHAGWGAEFAWYAYLRRSQFWPRFIRVASLFFVYLVFSIGVLRLFPHRDIPARGYTAFMFDLSVVVASVYALMILSCYVVDALVLNSNFIRVFMRSGKELGRELSERYRHQRSLTEEEESRLSTYSDIRLIADRTEVVARLIWYPLIVLAVMLVARSSFFDNWTWPLGLILILALNAVGAAVVGAMLLRRSAEKLREVAINNLRLLRLASYGVEAKREMFAELIAEVRGLKKGAFAPLSEQPFIRAIIVPSGGLGLLAVSQRLFESL